MYGGSWLGSLVPCPFRGGGFPPTSSSIIAKYLEPVGTQTQERRCSILPGCLLACPEFIEQCRVCVGRGGGTQERNIQGSVPGIIFSLYGAGPGPSCVLCVLPSGTDLLPTEEWAVPTPWKSPEFSWPGLGAMAIE